jgi:hypothetical protein
MENKMKDFIYALFPFFSSNPNERYRYLGYVWIPYDQGTYGYNVVLDVIKLIDSKATRWWVPRFILRLTQLLGNDNSVIRVRNRTIHKLHRWLTRGYFITDLKTKWHDNDIRIYGYFDGEIDKAIRKAENLIYGHYKNKKI